MRRIVMIEPSKNDPDRTVMLRIDGQTTFVEKSHLKTIAAQISSYAERGYIA